MQDAKLQAGEIIETYVYRKDEPTELIGTYEYNTGSLIIFFVGIVIVVGIICYWLGKKRR